MTLASSGLAAALGSIVVAGFAACAQKAEPPAPIPVRTAPIAMRSIRTGLEVSGSVVAAQNARVGAVVGGRILELRVRVGDRVAAGDVIATIDDASYRAQLAEAIAGAASAGANSAAAAAGVAQAQARLELARTTQRRMAQLYAQGAISRQQFDQTQADFQAASAVTAQAAAQQAAAADAVAQAGAAAEAASIAVSDGTIRAPFDGIVTERLADAGTAVGPGTPVVTIAGDRALEVDVAIPQANLAGLHRGTRVEVRSSASDAPSIGTVEGLAPADPELRSALARIALPTARGWMPGTFVRVALPGEPARGRTVPLEAIVTRGGQTGVFVVAGGKAVFAPVRTGAADMRDVEVTGLRPDDREVAVTNLERLTDGAAISVDR